MISISTLPLIETPEKFFDTDKVVLVDVIEIPRRTAKKFKGFSNNCFTHDGKTYLVFVLKGSPHNLFLKAKDGFFFQLGDVQGLYFWGKNLIEALQLKKVYDFSKHYDAYKHIAFPFKYETEFFINRYLETARQNELVGN